MKTREMDDETMEAVGTLRLPGGYEVPFWLMLGKPRKVRPALPAGQRGLPGRAK